MLTANSVVKAAAQRGAAPGAARLAGPPARRGRGAAQPRGRRPRLRARPRDLAQPRPQRPRVRPAGEAGHGVGPGLAGQVALGRCPRTVH